MNTGIKLTVLLSNGKNDEGRWRVMKGWILPFILKFPLFIGILDEKMKGEG